MGVDSCVRSASEQRARVAVVTGAGRGMGREHVLSLARLGFRTVAADIDPDTARATSKLAQDLGTESMSAELDVSDEAAVLGLAQSVEGAFGRVDVLINNAAIYHSMRLDPIMEMDIAYWRRMFAVNLDGALLCIQALAPLMKRNQWGRIINISSIAAYNGGAGPYGASKLALLHLTRAAAKELGGYCITVNAILPGPIDTEATAVTVGLDRMAANQASAPVSRLGTPGDIAGMVRFLVSDDASWVTAQALLVDGGAHVRY